MPPRRAALPTGRRRQLISLLAGQLLPPLMPKLSWTANAAGNAEKTPAER